MMMAHQPKKTRLPTAAIDKPASARARRAKPEAPKASAEKPARKKPGPKNCIADVVPPPEQEPGYRVFRPEMIAQARKLCELGATDTEVGRFFGVSSYTIVHWKMENKYFLEAMQAGKEFADERVTRSLFARAVGFEHPAVKVFYDHKAGEVVEHKYTEIYAPDTEAAKFWLMNRRPHLWRLVRETPPLDPHEAAEVAQMAVAKAMATSVREAEGLDPKAKVKVN